MAAMLLSLAVYAQIGSLANTLSVKDTTAWNSFESKMREIHKKRPVVALVLGGGGAKGAAHIGILKYLEEIKMPVDMVLGTSMGGLMGSMFSLGMTSQQIEQIVGNMDWDAMMSDKVPDDYISYNDRRYREKYALSVPFDIKNNHFLRSMPAAYISGQNVSNLISSCTVGYQGDINFADLPIPFVCVATDLIEGTGHVWLSGNLNTALRTTMSIPLVFSPVRHDGMFLIDGGMRNNFPADIAKALGADIIIGVSVGTPSLSYEDAANFLDVISLVIDLSGKTSLADTMEIPDLLIEPDLEGLGMLSFSKDNINTLISNGYNAAVQNTDAFDRIRQRVGRDTLRRNAPPAKVLAWDKVKIDEIHFTGISPIEEEILQDKVGVKAGQLLGKEELDHSVQKMYASNTFRNVQYKLPSDGENYKLIIDCSKGPMNQFGLGGRFDVEEMVGAFVNVGLNTHALYGMGFDANLKLSANPYAKFELFYDAPKVPLISVSADLRFANTSLMSYSDSPLKMSYFQSNQEITISDLHWIFFDLKGGLRNCVSDITNYDEADNNQSKNRHNYNRKMATGGLWDDVTNYTGVFINGTIDKLKGGENFPVSGYNINLNYDWQFKSNLHAGEHFRDYNHHSLSFGIKGAVSRGIFTYLPSFDTRMLFSRNASNIPLYSLNMLGGEMAGRYFAQQVEFCGFNNVLSAKDFMYILRNDFRFNVSGKQFITAKLHVALSSDKLLGGYDFGSMEAFLRNNAEIGTALEYSINTIIGPVKTSVCWSNSKSYTRFRGVGFYLGIGYKF